MDINHETVSTLAAAAPVIVGAGAWVYAKVLRPARETITQLVGLVPKVDSLYSELSSNGGLSIKDRVTRIDDGLGLLNFRSRITQEESPTAKYECDEHGMCTYVNTAASELFGLEPHEMVGNGWLNAIHPDDRVDQWQHWRRSIDNKVPFETVYTVTNRNTDQSYRVKATAAAITRADGKVLGYYGTAARVAEHDFTSN